ncbi:MAG: hypothetical protein N2257_07145 [Thermodesulfovibrionales bacterium]|nr:hypothetical protein [Thermodesulfovibrionales bacterium]
MNKLKIILILTLIVASYAEGTDQSSLPSGPVFQPVTERELPVEEKASSIELKVENNSVFLRTEGANLQELLKKLGEQAGFEVSMGSSSTTISILIKGLSVEDTIHRIMGIVQEKNYNIYYNEQGTIKKLEVLSEEGGPQRPFITPAQRPSIAPRLQRPQIPRPTTTLPSPEELPPPPVFKENEDE